MEYTLTPEIRRTIRNTIGDAFHRSVVRNKDREALIFGDRLWTYHALDEAVNRLANGLLALGLKPGERVAAYGKNSDMYVILWLACTRAGFIHVPINYALVESELEYIVEQSRSAALFYDPAIAEHVKHVQPRLSCRLYGTMYGGDELDLLRIAQGEGNIEPPEMPLDENDVVQLLYTSGTTSRPKGAMMTHRALLAEYMSVIIECQTDSSDRSLAPLPLYHSAQMHAFVMPQLLVGARIVLLPAPEPATVLRLIEEEKINTFFAPPTVWIALLRHPDFDRRDLSSLTKGFYGASIMPLPVLQELARRLPNARLFNAYGQSEMAPVATVLKPEDHKDRPASAGRPAINVETRVVDEQMRDMPPGELGEIVHRSPHAMIGYWDKPEETAEAFRGGWFHSGDVGYLDEAGYLYVVDRIKDIINTGGVVVSSREVEECLYTHPAVAEVAVIAVPDEKWIEAVTAVVTLKQGAKLDPQELIEYAKGKLAPFKVPKHVFIVDDLPRNTAGKLLKRELRARYADLLKGGKG